MVRFMMIVMVTLFMSGFVHAEEFKQHSLFDDEVESTGFGGFSTKISSIDGHTAFFSGGKGAWLINHTFYLGGGGYGLTNDINMTNPATSQGEILNVGYGGMLIGMHFFPEQVVHFNVESFIGSGGITFRNSSSTVSMNKSAFFIAEAGANAVVNVTKNFHVEFGMSYRKALGVTLIKSTALDAFSYNVSFLFGEF